MSTIVKISIVACSCRLIKSDDTNLDTLGLTFLHQGPTFINAHWQAATHLVDRDSSGGCDLP